MIFDARYDTASQVGTVDSEVAYRMTSDWENVFVGWALTAAHMSLKTQKDWKVP